MKNWTVRESGFQKNYIRKYESIMCQGNGYMGVRAATEEDYQKTIHYTLVAGTFDFAEELNTTELPNSADVTAVKITVNDIPLDLTVGKVEEYERCLSLYNGLLTRKFVWEPQEGLRIEFRSERFVSLKEIHVLGQRVSMKVLEGEATLGVESGILGGKRYGQPHFTKMQGYAHDEILQYAETTHESGITFVTSATIKTWKVNADSRNKTVLKTEIFKERERVTSSCKEHLKKGEEIHFEKLCRIATTRDKDAPRTELLLSREKEEMLKLRRRGYEDVWKCSRECWEELWKERDIEISGDADSDQRALRFAIYHLTIMMPSHDNRMNVGAKGLSGKDYWGHTFWDTEIYILPYFTWHAPQNARSLLENRFLSLDAARQKARKNGFEGAMYPWEAAWITDGDTCPKKHFIKQEIHVTADVAYGVYYYYEVTHDLDFMCKYGCEILFETAQFWKSRLEYRPDVDAYELCDVIGPDEFTHHADNNAYTNYLTWWNLKLAIEWKERLQREFPEDYERLNKKLDLKDRALKWRERKEKIILPKPNEDHILPQDSTYMSLPEIDLSAYRKKEKKLREDYPFPTYTRLKVSKQADVMNLFLLLEELFTDEVKRASLAYYEPYCVHESSLSLCAYSMLAADCGEDTKAYEFFVGARDIDLGLWNNSDHGIHAASLGGIWQCCVLGFAGVRMCGGEMCIRSNLPKHWDKMQFRLWWRGRHLEVLVTKDSADMKILETESVKEL